MCSQDLDMADREQVQLKEKEREHTEAEETSSDLIYGLEDKPPLQEAIFAALQHTLAVFVGIITPPIIIANALGLDPDTTSYLVSMALFVSGISTFIQTWKFGPVGSGLLSVQGTSFAFISPVVAAAQTRLDGGQSPDDVLGLLFGLCFCGAFVEIIVSRFLNLVKQYITPLITGTVVALIGLTLISVAVTNVGGGTAAKENGTFGSIENILIACLVIAVILICYSTKIRFLRMSSIVMGLIAGYVVSIFLGRVDFSNLGNLPIFTVPTPFRYGFSFDFVAFVPFAFIYLITAIESIGDFTATSAITNQPITGGTYFRRIKGGVLGDGINSLIAACFNCFPNTTFSQNNGIIKVTGVGSRYVGYFVAGFLVLLGLFPVVAGVFQAVPQPVLGGVTILLFGSVAVAGFEILSDVKLDKRSSIILALSLGVGLGISNVPELTNNFPSLLKSIFSSGIAAGGLCALCLNLVLPTRD